MSRVLVIGGGLAGLSAAFHLNEYDPIVFEKESTVGGICRSFSQDGFTFDVTGHLIHLKNDYTKDLIDRLLPDAFRPNERRAAIYSKGCVTPYPFQANTHGLPPEVVKECLLGFVESLGEDPTKAEDFHDWVLKTFGAGIARHFMLPFNEKFWKTDLRTITADWVSWSIPKPSLEEVVKGALGMTNRGMGYNPRFLYPKDGGIDCLPNALAGPLENIHTDHAVTSIDTGTKTVRFANGREEPYDFLISTVPLPVVYGLLVRPEPRMRDNAMKLRVLSVLDINIGIDRAGVNDQHWLYFPEDEFIFTRVGFPTNFSESVAPAGTSSMYIEVTHQRDPKPDPEKTFERAVEDLKKCGLLSDDDRILTRQFIDIPHAYVIFDRHRQAHLKELIDYLEERDIFPAGRYGRWEYFSMEDSILSGKAASRSVMERIHSVAANV